MKLDEFSLISFLSRKLSIFQPEVLIGIGDDTAVVKNGNKYSFYTTDVLVENVHFLDNWKSNVPDFYYFLGRKLITISASDVASMGGMPVYGLINLLIPEVYDLKELEEFYEGVSELCNELRISVIGGDTSKSSAKTFSFFLIGEGKKFMLRSNAKPGDLVAVTGTLGDSAAGLEQLLKKEIKVFPLVERFLNPTSRVREGVEVSNLGVITCTDVSDSLVFNLYTIAESSGIAIKVDSKNIPLSPHLLTYTTGSREKALRYALYGGEDYELIVTFEESLLSGVESLGFTVIGEVVEGEGVFVDNKKVEKKGYNHFGGER
ncbi:thiamine-phosphate kinase [Desulfurobacterium pacificum]|uniref:Thiamine-monophosphate kinase n=1 Tax=Desulfurobacterium pacificum TaxID=240166 RepID=A0ABY1N8P3_9BACT|nr:thiamine-phosphate kinase [Desulfurobacterium pacificum]SMP03413.1 thiamine-phosphate kinase [Desulfurobacterium pacificum]